MRRKGWTELYDWKVDRAGATPIFRQIYLQIRAAILSRTFAPGTKVPSTRALASRLSVARASVVSAYEQLIAEGYLAGTVGSGTHISSDLPEPIERAPTRLSKLRLANMRRISAREPLEIEFAGTMAQSDDRPFNTGRMLLDARTVEIWRTLTNRAMRSFGARHLMDRQPPSLQQTVLAEFMQDGSLAAHIRRMRLRYLNQRDVLVDQLRRRASSRLTIDVPDQGMHLVAFLKSDYSDVEIERAARDSGVVVRAMSRLYKKAPARSALLLGFSGYPPQRLISVAARLAGIVAKQVKSRPP